MGKTEDAFGKKRDHNQYGEVGKDRKDKKRNSEVPKSPNKASQKKKK